MPALAPRKDRAVAHAEISDLGRLIFALPLQALVVQCGGVAAWGELRNSIAESRKALGSSVSLSACLHMLAVHAALHRCGTIGYRGVIGAASEIGRHAARLAGGLSRGYSDRTVREAYKVLEAAGLVERSRYGRGKPIVLPDGSVRCAGVLCVTTSIVALSYWTTGGAQMRVAPGLQKNQAANFAEKPIISEKKPSVFQNARLCRDDRSCELPTSDELAFARTVETSDTGASVSSVVVPSSVSAELASARHGEGLASARSPRGGQPQDPCHAPRRLIKSRPSASAPNTARVCAAACLYDLETAMIRNGRGDARKLLGVARREIEGRFFAGILSGGVGASGVPWWDILWGWRALPESDRSRRAREIIPSLVAVINAGRLAAYPPANRWIAPVWQAEPGPRMRPCAAGSARVVGNQTAGATGAAAFTAQILERLERKGLL
jgi:hypothetical protein